MLFADAGPKTRLLLLALAVLLPGGAHAQAPDSTPGAGLSAPSIKAEATLREALDVLDGSPGTVVADVGSRTVTWGDVADQIRAMPRIVSAIPFQQIYQTAAIEAMERQALVIVGENAGLDKNPIVQRRMKNAADEALANEVLHKSLAPNVSDEALRILYKGVVDGKPGPDEVQARIIMVGTKEEATTLIRRLQGGADFAALAKDFSKDGTASRGGDLGYVPLEMLEPELGSVIFALAPGQMTAFPVRSGNFWFIVKVEGRRQPPTPTFEQARAGLAQDMMHAGMPQLMRMALKATKVKYNGLAGVKASDEAPK